MQDTLSSEQSVELARLWRRRQTLSSQEMGEMYRMVGSALGSCHPPESRAPGEGRAELVAQFVYAKVLRLDADPDEAEEHGGEADTGGHGSAPSTAVALCAQFRRYLVDCTRAGSFRRRCSSGEQLTGDPLEAAVGAAEDAEDALAEHGLDTHSVQAAARAFIAGLPEPERILLCEGFGRDAQGGLPGPASRHAIASYHYRAGRLGLVHEREGLPADYARTTLGQWISQTLGIPIEAGNMGAIRQVFKILGAEASWA
jgi:hypothetical protein